MPRLRTFPHRFPCLIAIFLFFWLTGLVPGEFPRAGAFNLQAPDAVLVPPAGLTVDAFADRNQVDAGGRFLLYVLVTLEPGWHIYSLESQDDPTLPTRILLGPHPFAPEGEWQESAPEIVEDKTLGRMVKVHSGRTEFQRPFAVPPGLKPGPYRLHGTFTYRSCDNKVCTAPREIGFNTRIEVIPEDRS